MNYIETNRIVMVGTTAGGPSNTVFADARIKSTHRVSASFTGPPSSACALIATVSAGQVNFEFRRSSDNVSIGVTPAVAFVVIE